jgi:hypothetical protein
MTEARILVRANPDKETTNGRAVCGSIARTFWQEGRAGLFSTLIELIGDF